MTASVRTKWLPDEATVYVTVHGDVDGPTSDELRTKLVAALMRRRPTCIVVDFGEATTVDPIALGTLAAACDAASDLGITFTVVGLGAPPDALTPVCRPSPR